MVTFKMYHIQSVMVGWMAVSHWIAWPPHQFHEFPYKRNVNTQVAHSENKEGLTA